MKRWLTIGTVTLLTSGCLTTPNTSNAVYLIDTERGNFCQIATNTCISLSIVASQNGRVQPIESLYAEQVTGPNYPRSLQRMLLNPKDGSYKATPVDNNGRAFQLPGNQKTHTAWRTLQDLYSHIYD